MSYLSCLKVIKVKCVFYCRSISILYTNVLVPFIMYLLEILTALFVLFFYLNTMLSGKKAHYLPISEENSLPLKGALLTALETGRGTEEA